MTLGLFGLFPGLHYFYVEGIEHVTNYGVWLLSMAVWYLMGGTIYALRVPERFFPGKFDIAVSFINNCST